MIKAVYCLFAVAGAAIIISMLKTKKFVPALLLSALQGVIALFAADFAGGFFGINLSINPQTLLLSAIGGIPAVIFLLISGIFFL